MTVREIDKEILRKGRRILRYRGQQKAAIEATGINKNFMSAIKNGKKTALIDANATKFENYIRSL